MRRVLASWPLAVIIVLVLALSAGLIATGEWESDQGAASTSVPVESGAPTPTPSPAPAPVVLPEPTAGEVSFGAHIHWEHDTPRSYAERLGRTPVYVGVFVDLPFEPGVVESLDEAAAALLAEGAALFLTLEPNEGLDRVTDEVLAELTEWLVEWNERGLAVLVRFAHEMNGGWYPWGQQPEAYVTTFRRAAEAVRAAPSSEIMWAPNEGGGYPFPGGDYNATSGDPGFELLDTDGDGELTQQDDPYGPYYPGDDHVDRVGLTVYHFGAQWPWGDNVVPEPEKFVAKVLGRYDGTEGDQTAVPDFHAEYAHGRNLPLTIAETSALFNEERPTPPGGELEVKTAWLEQVLAEDLLDDLPALDAVIWFEIRKLEAEIDDEMISWSLTEDPEVLEAFVDAFPTWLRFADSP